MKFGWLTDIHLNFLGERALQSFLQSLEAHPVDAWLISGDIAEAPTLTAFLRLLEEVVAKPILFVLGNHDYYHSGSIDSVRAEVAALAGRSQHLRYLTVLEAQSFLGSIAVVGDDGWADARLGNAETTPVELNDFHLIPDLAGRERGDLIQVLDRLGMESAERLASKLSVISESVLTIVVVTHVPPYREAAWHEGKISEDDWLPWFSCAQVGKAILEHANRRPQTAFRILCGHTHGSGACAPAANVLVYTAGARYGAPGVAGVFDF